MRIQGETAAGIFDSIRDQVQARVIAPGQALPPVRELAVALGVNRNTVAAAYKRLVSAGIAITQGRHGTSIRPAQGPGEQEGSLPGSPLTDLASGNPATAWLPDMARVCRAVAPVPRLYGEPTLNADLADSARAWLDDDPPAGYALDLCHGAVDAVERLLAAWLAPGDKVAVEDPCFLGSLNTLRHVGLVPVGVPVDEEGLRPEALADSLAQGVRAVICTPRAHNPTGASFSPARAKALRRVLADFPQALLIEDDHFGPLSATPYRSLIAPATAHWALVRTLSKCHGPDLRLAVVASDAETSRRLRLRLAPGNVWVSHVLQDMAHVLLSSPEDSRRVGEAREDYAQRRRTLADALRAQGIASWSRGDGLNVWVPLPVAGRDVAERLARLGWLVRVADSFCVDTPVQAIRVTVAELAPARAARFARDLRACLDALQAAA